MVKVGKTSLYLIGTDVKMVNIRKNEARILTGTGFISVSDFIENQAVMQFTEIMKRMKSDKISFEKAVNKYYEDFARQNRMTLQKDRDSVA